MAITILGYFYHQSKNKNNYEDFKKLINLVASFYTLWRSSNSNSGLDNIYRVFFKGDKKLQITSQCWIQKRGIELSDVVNYLKSVIVKNELYSYSDWYSKSKFKLNYNDANKVCRYALMIYLTNSIEDKDNPGLLKKGKAGTKDFLTWKNWTSMKYNTLEHIAPQKTDGTWDEKIYGEERISDLIGNLTLLPLDINALLSNNSWEHKRRIYNIIGENDKEKAEAEINDLIKEDQKLKSKLFELNNLELYGSVSFITHLPSNFFWNKEFIVKRTENILKIIWDFMRL